jgi:hypothetical protein
MTDPATFLALAERCEQAAGPEIPGRLTIFPTSGKWFR